MKTRPKKITASAIVTQKRMRSMPRRAVNTPPVSAPVRPPNPAPLLCRMTPRIKPTEVIISAISKNFIHTMCLLEISGQIIPVQEVNRQQGFGAIIRICKAKNKYGEEFHARNRRQFAHAHKILRRKRNTQGYCRRRAKSRRGCGDRDRP